MSDFIGMNVELDIDLSSAMKSMNNFTLGIGEMIENGGKANKGSAIGSVLFRDPQEVNKLMKKGATAIGGGFKRIGKDLNTLSKNATGGVLDFGKMGKGMKGFAKVAAAEFKGLGKVIGATFSPIAKMFGMGKGGIGRKAGGYVGKGLGFAGMMGAGGISGFITGAFRESIGAFEGQQNARLGAAPYLTGMNKKGFGNRKARFASGNRLGYNDIESAQIQSMGAKMGMGQSKAGGKASMELLRGYGQEGLMAGSGMMRRGEKDLSSMKIKMARMIGAGVKSGLDDARIGEFLQASNNYAEQQLSVTPGKGDMMNYAKQLAGLQSSGVAGFKGKYGAQHMGRFDKAIKGAQGPGQSFLMRAFGFGKGKSFFNVLQRQERGIGDPNNLKDVMDQLKSEYGANKKGGLSEQALVAFKSMGMGTTHTGQALSKLMYSSNGMGDKEKRDQIKKIMDGQKDRALAPIQRRAYKAIVDEFGGPAKLNAGRFSAYAGAGGKNYAIKGAMTSAAINMLGVVAPLMKKIAIPFAEAVAAYIKKNKGKFTGWMSTAADWIKDAARIATNIVSGMANLASAINNSWFGGKAKPLPQNVHTSTSAPSAGASNRISMNSKKFWKQKASKGLLQGLAAARAQQKMMLSLPGKTPALGQSTVPVDIGDGKKTMISFDKIIQLLEKWDFLHGTNNTAKLGPAGRTKYKRYRSTRGALK